MTIDLLKQFHAFRAYFYYWLLQEDRHAVQSPLVFDIYDGLFKNSKLSVNNDLDLEIIRIKLLGDYQILNIEDFGAGSKKLKSPKRITSNITRHSTTGRRFSQLYQYFCRMTPARQVIELGTCVGINTLYLSRAVKGTLYTFEGSEALYRKAQEYSKPANIKYIYGNIKQTLPNLLQHIDQVDFALIDATHTYEATLSYFETILPYIKSSGILAVGDIHWSQEMEAAWKEIRNHPSVSISMDFYECGILLIKEGVPKNHYVLRF